MYLLALKTFALDSIVVKTKKMFSSHGGFLSDAMLLISQRNNLIKLTHYVEAKKMAHDSQISRAKESLKLNYG